MENTGPEISAEYHDSAAPITAQPCPCECCCRWPIRTVCFASMQGNTRDTMVCSLTRTRLTYFPSVEPRSHWSASVCASFAGSRHGPNLIATYARLKYRAG